MAESVYYFRPSRLINALRTLRGSYRLIPLDRDEPRVPAVESPAILIADATRDDTESIRSLTSATGAWRVIVLFDRRPSWHSNWGDLAFAALPRSAPPIALRKAVQSASATLRSSVEQEGTREELRHVVSDLETLNKIGVALSTERNTDSLLELILTKSREITVCDAGSLYLAEEDPEGEKRLVFRLTQSDSHAVPFRQFTMPIDTRSIAGYAAATGKILNIKDAYRIRHLPFRLNREFDEKFGYRTKSMLVVPMKNQKDEVIGVLQLINAKKHRDAKLTSRRAVREEVIPFSQRSQELAASLASQAAVALENNLLYRNIQRLFEGFVKASVTAIEARDPTTFGHSERVAKLTVALAEAVNRGDCGPYKEVHFSPVDIQQIRYAALLHDFGKVGVREEVLVKAKKLYPGQLDVIKKRFLYVRKLVELDGYQKKLDYILRNGNQNYEQFFAEMDAENESQLQMLDDFLQHILRANEPTVLPGNTSEKLMEISSWSLKGLTEPVESLLTPDELRLLFIPQGSLDPDERLQIESHVIHSYRFLSQIPWTKELRGIPEIAKAHHEKLDGSGYPYRMKADEIPLQSRMMTIADMFDALTAHDRPYKRSVTVERALEVIGGEAQSQLLDPFLFQLFVEAKVFQITSKD